MIPSVPGLSRAEVEIGLYMNMTRIEAKRIVSQATAVGVAFDPSGSKPILEAAGVDPKITQSAEIEQWKQRGMSRVLRNS